jgi:hypothetical protein
MKLYTEEQVKEIYFKGVHNGRLHIEGKCSDEVELLIPIELPSDEEIKKVLIQYNDYLFTFIDKDEIGINVETEDVIKWYNETFGGGEQ